MQMLNMRIKGKRHSEKKIYLTPRAGLLRVSTKLFIVYTIFTTIYTCFGL